jgi:DnaJ-class molecular chaperone
MASLLSGCDVATALPSRHARASGTAWNCSGQGLFACRHEDPGQQLGRRSRGGAGVYAQDQFDPDEIFNMFFGGGGFGPRRAPNLSARQQPLACSIPWSLTAAPVSIPQQAALCSAW